MFLSHSCWLCIILPTLIAAIPQKTAPARSKRSLPPKLQQEVPACAQPCLRISLSEQFPFACTTPVNLNCLCSRYSFLGQTLGEVAVGCIYASCSTFNGTTPAYNVCLGEKYAVAPTLSAITVVKTSSTPTSMASSRSVVSTTTHLITRTTSTPRPQTSHTETVIVDSVSLVPSPTSTSQQSTTPLAAAGPPKTMSPAQIAGLAVAVGAAFVIAIGLVGLTIFLRRRRERKNLAKANEKGGLSPSPSEYLPRYSHPFSSEILSPDPPPHRFLLPLPPPPTQRRSPSPSPKTNNESNVGLKPLRLSAARNANIRNISSERLIMPSNTNSSAVHPLLRPTQGIPNNESGTSVPLEQIGLAITAEQPRSSTDRSELKPKALAKETKQQRPFIARRNADIAHRPDSVMTQTTLFEEDDVRRESKLLPALPLVPIPPIRTFQPSRPQPAASPIQAAMERPSIRQVPQQPELFLDIPVRYSRSQLATAETSDVLSRGRRQSTLANRTQRTHCAQTSEHNPMSAESELSHGGGGGGGGDIPDYYFTAYQEPKAIHSVSSSKLNKNFRQKQDQSYSTKPKRSSSNVSRATSRASTNIRDSFSSQTSFETVDPDDPTPEDDESDRRLATGKLSPVAESPIHKLRYPKVPRTSNQLVPRSPKSPQSQASQGSPRWQSQPSSSLLAKRKGEQGNLTLGSPFRTGSPDARTTSEIRRYRNHLRSSSVETFAPMRNSERSTRTQSSLWPKSPAMFDEPPAVRPLTIRKTQQFLQTPTDEMHALKSPVWVPRLTPTRQGDDLFINVTYSKPGR